MLDLNEIKREILKISEVLKIDKFEACCLETRMFLKILEQIYGDELNVFQRQSVALMLTMSIDPCKYFMYLSDDEISIDCGKLSFTNVNIDKKYSFDLYENNKKFLKISYYNESINDKWRSTSLYLDKFGKSGLKLTAVKDYIYDSLYGCSINENGIIDNSYYEAKSTFCDSGIYGDLQNVGRILSKNKYYKTESGKYRVIYDSETGVYVDGKFNRNYALLRLSKLEAKYLENIGSVESITSSGKTVICSKFYKDYCDEMMVSLMGPIFLNDDCNYSDISPDFYMNTCLSEPGMIDELSSRECSELYGSIHKNGVIKNRVRNKIVPFKKKDC